MLWQMLLATSAIYSLTGINYFSPVLQLLQYVMKCTVVALSLKGAVGKRERNSVRECSERTRGSLGEPGLAEGVPDHGKRLELDDL